MRTIWIIARKEFSTFFDSLTAYILMVIFLGLSGLFTWIYGSDIFLINQVTMQPFFNVAYWTLFFFAPALTMRSIAEEKRSGTLELLLTKSITNGQFILGKFLASLMMISISLLATLPYYFTLTRLGDVDHGAIICGYFGLLFMSSVFLSIGIFSSAVTNNQIVAFLLSLFIGVFFIILFQTLASNFTGTLGEFLNYLSISSHYNSISRGVIDTKDLIYFISITMLALFYAESVMAKRLVIQ